MESVMNICKRSDHDLVVSVCAFKGEKVICSLSMEEFNNRSSSSMTYHLKTLLYTLRYKGKKAVSRAVPFQKVNLCSWRIHIGTLMVHISTWSVYISTWKVPKSSDSFCFLFFLRVDLEANSRSELSDGRELIINNYLSQICSIGSFV